MIEAQALTKDYGNKRAVDGLTFTVRPGIVTGFLGPNGSGKSTTMRLILGLDRPTSGTVSVNGKRYREHAAPLREVGALLEARAVHTGRSAYNHLLALAQTHGIPRSRVEQLIDMVGLREVAKKRVGEFSLGMAQRLGIANVQVLPMTDHAVETWVQLQEDASWVHFQEYFVHRRTDVAISEVRVRGIEQALPAPGVLEAIAAADLVVFCPSNPFVSVGPILQVWFSKQRIRNYRDAARHADHAMFRHWWEQMLVRGILFHPGAFENLFVSFAHSDDDIELTLAAAREAAQHLRNHV